MTADRPPVGIGARGTVGGKRREIYFVVTPATGDLRRVERETMELPETTLARAIAAAEPGDFVAVLSRGQLSRVWTAGADS